MLVFYVCVVVFCANDIVSLKVLTRIKLNSHLFWLLLSDVDDHFFFNNKKEIIKISANKL